MARDRRDDAVTSDPAFQDVARRFADRVAIERATLAAIVDALPSRMPAVREIRELAHRLAGSASIFGWARLGKAASALEELASGGHADAPMLHRMVMVVIAEMDKVCEGNE